MTGRMRTRTTKAQGLMQIEPPAMMDTTIAQQYQIDDSENDLQDPDIEEVRWRDGVALCERHIVVAVNSWRLRFEINATSVCYRIGWESPSP